MTDIGGLNGNSMLAHTVFSPKTDYVILSCRSIGVSTEKSSCNEAWTGLKIHNYFYFAENAVWYKGHGMAWFIRPFVKVLVLSVQVISQEWSEGK